MTRSDLGGDPGRSLASGRAGGRTHRNEWWWAGAVAVVTAAWVLVAMAGGDPAPVATTAMGAAAAAATAALVGVGWNVSSVETAQFAGAALAILPLGAAAAAGGSAPLLVGAVGVVCVGHVVDAVRAHRTVLVPAVSASGAALIAIGVVMARLDGQGWRLASDGHLPAGLVLAGGALLVAMATVGPPRLRPVVVAGALAALAGASALPALAVAGGAGVLAAGWTAAAGRRPGPAIIVVAVAAAAVVPGARSAALLLVAAGVLAVAIDHRAGGVLALPGVAGLVLALLAAPPTTEVKVIAAGSLVVAMLIAAAPAAAAAHPGRPPAQAFPALALGLWLLVAPQTWGWVGASASGAYQAGVAVAGAGAALVLVTRRLAGVTRLASVRPRPRGRPLIRRGVGRRALTRSPR